MQSYVTINVGQVCWEGKYCVLHLQKKKAYGQVTQTRLHLNMEISTQLYFKIFKKFL